MLERKHIKAQLFKITQCDVQHDGWPCNTCFHAIDFGIDADKQHELWLSLLAYRGDYTLADVEQSEDTMLDNMHALNNMIALA